MLARVARSSLAPRARTLAYACTPYREMAWATPDQRAAWAEADSVLHARMREHVPEALAHNGEEVRCVCVWPCPPS